MDRRRLDIDVRVLTHISFRLSADSQWTLSGLLADSWQSGRFSTDSRQILNRLSALSRHPLGRLSADSWQTLGRLSADSRQTLGRLSADSWQTLGRLSATSRRFSARLSARFSADSLQTLRIIKYYSKNYL
jgi:hypothetical protein